MSKSNLKVEITDVAPSNTDIFIRGNILDSISNDGDLRTIVMVTGPGLSDTEFSGVELFHSRKTSFTPGVISNNFARKYFTPFTGKLTLSNGDA